MRPKALPISAMQIEQPNPTMMFSFSRSFQSLVHATCRLAKTCRAHAAHLKRAVRKIQFGSKQGNIPGKLCLKNPCGNSTPRAGSARLQASTCSNLKWPPEGGRHKSVRNLGGRTGSGRWQRELSGGVNRFWRQNRGAEQYPDNPTVTRGRNSPRCHIRQRGATAIPSPELCR